MSLSYSHIKHPISLLELNMVLYFDHTIKTVSLLFFYSTPSEVLEITKRPSSHFPHKNVYGYSAISFMTGLSVFYSIPAISEPLIRQPWRNRSSKNEGAAHDIAEIPEIYLCGISAISCAALSFLDLLLRQRCRIRGSDITGML